MNCEKCLKESYIRYTDDIYTKSGLCESCYFKEHNIKDGICKNCNESKLVYTDLCYRCINRISSDNYLCSKCLELYGQKVKGTHRYDSLVLCDEHNKPMGDIMNKLHDILDNNPNVTTIKDLGL